MKRYLTLIITLIICHVHAQDIGLKIGDEVPDFAIGKLVGSNAKYRINDFKNQFLDSEWRDISTSNNVLDKFYHYWTAKEAVIKADGKGLSLPLTDIKIEDDIALVGSKIWHLTDIHLLNSYKMKIATEYKTENKIKYKAVSFNL